MAAVNLSFSHLDNVSLSIGALITLSEGSYAILHWLQLLRGVEAVVALLGALLAIAVACSKTESQRARAAYITTGGGKASAGRNAIRKYGCYACHTIAGVAGAHGLVGPPLNGIVNRQYIAGEVPNTAESLMRWIQHPRSVEPHTIMPEMNVSEQDSRDIAAYLYTLQGKD